MIDSNSAACKYGSSSSRWAISAGRQLGDAVVVVAILEGEIRVAAQELEVLPVQQRALGAAAEQPTAHPPQDGPGTDVRSDQRQLAVGLAQPQVVGPRGLAVRHVDDQRVHEVALEQHAVRQRLGSIQACRPGDRRRRSVADASRPDRTAAHSSSRCASARVADDELADGRVVASGRVDRGVNQSGPSTPVVDQRESRELREHHHLSVRAWQPVDGTADQLRERHAQHRPRWLRPRGSGRRQNPTVANRRGDAEEHGLARGQNRLRVHAAANAAHVWPLGKDQLPGSLPTTSARIAMQDERSQLQNREKAMRVLRARIFESERERQAAVQAAARSAQVGTGARAEKIRTYNFPQSRVTDHRVKLNVPLEQVLQGTLEEFTDALTAEEQRRALETASV